MIPDNAWTLRITAAAGTELAGPYSYSTVKLSSRESVSSYIKAVYNPLVLTAASRRSLVRVSVPVWGIPLSGPLPIDVLVSRYLTNKLIGRIVILYRNL
jgi:hypothetical protein